MNFQSITGSRVFKLLRETFARRRAEEAQEPVTRIREGFAGLGERAAENLAALVERARREVSRRVS